MTLEEAIIHCKEKACDNTQCALEHRQLAEWLKELQSLKSYKNNSIEERARLAAWQIFEEIGLSQHSVDRVSEIIAEKMSEQKDIDIDNACKWLINIDFDDFHFRDCDETFNNDLFIDAFKRAMEE